MADTGYGLYGMVYVEQRGVVGIQIGTYVGMDTGWPTAFHTERLVVSFHSVHVG